MNLVQDPMMLSIVTKINTKIALKVLLSHLLPIEIFLMQKNMKKYLNKLKNQNSTKDNQ
jgi:hypothetical protein